MNTISHGSALAGGRADMDGTLGREIIIASTSAKGESPQGRLITDGETRHYLQRRSDVISGEQRVLLVPQAQMTRHRAKRE
jgi:hypothetical protein